MIDLKTSWAVTPKVLHTEPPNSKALRPREVVGILLMKDALPAAWTRRQY